MTRPSTRARWHVGATASVRAQDDAVHDTSHDRRAGGLHVGVVDTAFDIANSLGFRGARGVAFRLVLGAHGAVDLVAIPARNSEAIWITDNDTDKLGVSDPRVAAGVRVPGRHPGSLTPRFPH